MHRRRRLLGWLILSAALTGCGRVEPCPDDGIIDGSLVVDEATFGFLRGDDASPQPVLEEDLAECTVVAGNLMLAGAREGAALSMLDRVDGYVLVGVDFQSQEELLPSLEFIGGALIVDASGDLNGFNSVQTVTSVFFSPLSDIVRLQIFERLESVSEGLAIRAQVITGLSSLRSANSVLLEGVEMADEFGSLESIGGALHVERSALTTLPFPVLAEIGEELRLAGNAQLSFSGLENVRSVGDLAIANNDVLEIGQVLTWIDGLESAGSLMSCGNVGDVPCGP